MASAYKVGVKKTYRERAQPTQRRRFGLLEKKRDYQKRARDYKRKQRSLTRLRMAAELRNPDEFYFGMQNAQTTDDGKHQLVDKKQFSADELRVMDEQDLGYLTTRAQEEKQKVARLRASLHGLEARAAEAEDRRKRRRRRKAPKHIVFVEKEKDVVKFNAEEHFDTPSEALSRAYNRPRTSALAEDDLVLGGADERTLDAVEQARDKSYAELQAREVRLARIERMREALELRKALQGPGRRRQIVSKAKSKTGVAKYKWSKERKR